MQERATLSKKLVEEANIQEQERDEAHRFASSAEDEVHLLQTASKLMQESAHENGIVHDLRLKVPLLFCEMCVLHCETYLLRDLLYLLHCETLINTTFLDE